MLSVIMVVFTASGKSIVTNLRRTQAPLTALSLYVRIFIENNIRL